MRRRTIRPPAICTFVGFVWWACSGMLIETREAGQPSPALGAVGAADITVQSLSPLSSVPELLHKRGAYAAIPELRALLQSGSLWDRVDAAEALRGMSPETTAIKSEITTALVDLMNSRRQTFARQESIWEPPVFDARFEAAWVLVKVDPRHPAIVPWCVDRIRQAENMSRVKHVPESSRIDWCWMGDESANILRATQSSQAVPGLVKMLLSQRGDWFDSATDALGSLGVNAQTAVPELKRAYLRYSTESGHDKRVARIALTLGQIGGVAHDALTSLCHVGRYGTFFTAVMQELPKEWRVRNDAEFAGCLASRESEGPSLTDAYGWLEREASKRIASRHFSELRQRRADYCDHYLLGIPVDPLIAGKRSLPGGCFGSAVNPLGPSISKVLCRNSDAR